MVAIHKAFMEIYPAADQSCKDATRIFYGSINCEIKEKRKGVLTDDIVRDLIAFGTVEDPVVPETVHVYDDDDDTEIGEILDELKKNYSVLEYNRRRNVTWAVMSKLPASKAIALMRSRWSDVPSTAKYEELAKGYKPGKIGFGLIINMIRAKDGSYRRPTKPLFKETMVGTEINKNMLL